MIMFTFCSRVRFRHRITASADPCRWVATKIHNAYTPTFPRIIGSQNLPMGNKITAHSTEANGGGMVQIIDGDGGGATADQGESSPFT